MSHRPSTEEAAAFTFQSLSGYFQRRMYVPLISVRNARPVFVLLAALLFLLSCGAVASAAAQQSKRGEQKTGADRLPDFPMSDWLRSGKREDFRWSVQITDPRLTYQQRYILRVRADVDGKHLRGSSHELYFILKVADAQGRWFDGVTDNHFPVPATIDKSSEVEYDTAFYAKPGEYTVALLLYDASSGKGNVWEKHVHVKGMNHDPLPELDRNLPPVEFMSDVPQDLPNTKISSHGGAIDPHDEWPPSHESEWLPVHNPRPLRVDVLLNFSPWQDPNSRRQVPETVHRIQVGRMVHIGSLLSHLALDHGCVKLTGFDLSRPAVIFDRVDAATADWDELAAKVKKTEHATVDVRALETPSIGAAFLRDLLVSVAKDQGCPDAAGDSDHAILVVTHSFQFPNGVHVQDFAPTIECACRFFQVRVGSRNYLFNDFDKFLKNVDAVNIDADDPEKFRKSLAELIGDLSSPGLKSPAH